jgi:hypothetical protein
VPFKTQLKQSHTTVKECNQKQVYPRVIDKRSFLADSSVKVILLARPLLTSVAQRFCRCKHGVFTLEHYTATKSFAALHEAFSNAYPDTEVPNKATVHRLVTKLRDTRNICVTSVRRVTKQPKLRPCRFQAVHHFARIGYGFKNSLLTLVSSFSAAGVHVEVAVIVTF